MTLVFPPGFLENLHLIQSKPSAKLTVNERYAILALKLKLRVSAQSLADMFDVSLVTVHQICSPKTPTYRYVREKLGEIGLDNMYVEYVTQDMLDKVNAHVNTIGQRKVEPIVIAHDMPHKASRRHEGDHSINGHRFTIQWLEAGQGPLEAKEGWYFMVPDKFPDKWLGGTKGAPFTTSKDCLAFCKDLAEYW